MSDESQVENAASIEVQGSVGTADLATLDDAPPAVNQPPVLELDVPLPPLPPDAKSDEADAPAEPAVDPNTPIGSRWFTVSTRSQPGPVNLLLRGAVAGWEKNVAAVIERFKRGHGITHTPHDIRVGMQPADYLPTAADLDHHEAIEAALASPPSI